MRSDPRWINLKYPCKRRDGTVIPKGTRVWFYPNTGHVIDGEHAEQAARDFEAACFDEQVQS